jgi:DNA-binding MarR family transcriptional regulator
MHDEGMLALPPVDAPAARAANLLGALALEAERRRERATEAVVGRSGAAAAALVVIAARPGWSIEQLRGPLGLSQPGAVRLVDALASAGWVKRAGPGGRRGLQLRLTDDGARVVDELLTARRAALASLLAPLSDADTARLAALLETILAAATGDRADLERLCRLCERRSCSRCPVAHAFEISAG